MEFPRVVVEFFQNCSIEEVVKIAALSITWSHTAGSTAKGRWSRVCQFRSQPRRTQPMGHAVRRWNSQPVKISEKLVRLLCFYPPSSSLLQIQMRRMCRRGIFKNWSGGKTNVPVCPVGGPSKVQQLFGMMGGSSKVADTFV